MNGRPWRLYPLERSIMTMNRIPGADLGRAQQADQYARPQRRRADGADGPGNVATPPAQQAADQAEISDRARAMVDLRAAVDAGRAALDALPDVRADRLATVRERLESGYYQSAAVREKVAGQLLGVMFGGETP
jgi:hypothetical protein